MHQKSFEARASSQTLLVELTARSPNPLAEFKGTTLRPLFLMGEEGKEGERGRRNELCLRAPETLAPPLHYQLSFNI